MIFSIDCSRASGVSGLILIRCMPLSSLCGEQFKCCEQARFFRVKRINCNLCKFVWLMTIKTISAAYIGLKCATNSSSSLCYKWWWTRVSTWSWVNPICCLGAVCVLLCVALQHACYINKNKLEINGVKIQSLTFFEIKIK